MDCRRNEDILNEIKAEQYINITGFRVLTECRDRVSKLP
jgi:hypothetical protein